MWAKVEALITCHYWITPEQRKPLGLPKEATIPDENSFPSGSSSRQREETFSTGAIAPHYELASAPISHVRECLKCLASTCSPWSQDLTPLRYACTIFRRVSTHWLSSNGCTRPGYTNNGKFALRSWSTTNEHHATASYHAVSAPRQMRILRSIRRREKGSEWHSVVFLRKPTAIEALAHLVHAGHL